MTPDVTGPAEQAAQLQEAIDVIAGTFDHPSSLSIQYTTSGGSKRTTIEVEPTAETFELSYYGREDEAEPELTRME